VEPEHWALQRDRNAQQDREDTQHSDAIDECHARLHDAQDEQNLAEDQNRVIERPAVGCQSHRQAEHGMDHVEPDDRGT